VWVVGRDHSRAVGLEFPAPGPVRRFETVEPSSNYLIGNRPGAIGVLTEAYEVGWKDKALDVRTSELERYPVQEFPMTSLVQGLDGSRSQLDPVLLVVLQGGDPTLLRERGRLRIEGRRGKSQIIRQPDELLSPHALDQSASPPLAVRWASRNRPTSA
jgi:hypothetical protein